MSAEAKEREARPACRDHWESRFHRKPVDVAPAGWWRPCKICLERFGDPYEFDEIVIVSGSGHSGVVAHVPRSAVDGEADGR